MNEPKDKRTSNPDKGAGSGGSPDNKKPEENKEGKAPEMVAMPKEEIEIIRKIGDNLQNYTGAISRIENRFKEVEKKQDTLNKRFNQQLFGGGDPDEGNDEDTEKKGSDIERDLDRNAADVLAQQPEYSTLSEKVKPDFESEWKMRVSALKNEATTTGRFVTQTELKSAFTRSLRAVTSQEDQQALERARAEGAADADRRGQGSVSSTSSVDRKSNDISAEAMDIARKSVLVSEGKITLDEMAKRVQSRLENRGT
jgi:hypothetical protein